MMDGVPKISVIIPCYNQGAYLEEAVQSVLAQTFQEFEILIVDDGSTDGATIRLLKDCAWPKTRVIHTDNQGLAAARNNGIQEARGACILPLDADDRIGPGYLEEAVHILDQYPEIGIVYCEAAYFGARSDHWHLPDYTPDNMLFQNLIFCSALFRREDWEKAGGYNINMVYGWEDWDFWLSLIHLGVKVYRIPKVHFFYRLRDASMIQAMDEGKQFFMRLHAVLNHRDLYRRTAEIRITARVAELFFDTGMGFTPHQVIRRVVFGDERLLEFDLSGCGPIRQVRFHPMNAPLAIQIERLEATDAQGNIHPLAPVQSNALWQEGGHWIFRDNHPWIIVDLESVAAPRNLSVHLRYLAVGSEVYSEILKAKEHEGVRKLQVKEEEIKTLREEIRRTNATIQELTNSTSWQLTRPLRRLKEILKP
jgi:glycosyltransferase involved in cell wall biosynthesis